MNRTTLILLKTLTWIACLSPLRAGSSMGRVTNTLGPDPTAHHRVRHRLTTLWLLLIIAGHHAAAPLSPRLSWLIKFRRLLGLFAFFYATLHLLT